jgi:hypothetical protein
MIAFMLAFSLSGELAFAFQCKPVRAAFDKTILITNPNAKCYSSNTMFGLTMYQGVIMFVCDVIIIILPMPSIWALQLPMKKRFLLLGMFSFGMYSIQETGATVLRKLISINRFCCVYRSSRPI